ncbi:NRDE family protein [Rhodonellum sp.]|uniref:NRDE family protein n=1 Tax=Rhodonellum sp. TaxID=2231180 RepID=UPI0027273751|nr:NRDE family protein [Rhodonellum sp.]MDO9553580.1 NRDE family protein [Rhodonellum sp.]
MCLIAFNWNNHPEYKMVLVANRDEFFERPSAPLQLWDSGFYAGKDLRAGGTWMGIHPNGRFATLTNFRDLKNPRKDPTTRGNLVKDFLEGTLDPKEYLTMIQKEKDEYEGFNLVIGNHEKLYYLSNYADGIQEVEPGLHGLSNAFLNTPWEKVKIAKSGLLEKIEAQELDLENLIPTLHSRQMEPDHLLPDTGLSVREEKQLSAQFINVGDYYGTINSTVILWKHTGEVEMMERTFHQVEKRFADSKVIFRIQS